MADGSSKVDDLESRPMVAERFRLPRCVAEHVLGERIRAKATELEALLAKIPAVRTEMGLLMEAQPTNALPPPSAARYLTLATSDLESAVTNALKALTA